jgi:hypothetical protein
MADYGTCAKCGKEIDAQKGYSKLHGVEARFCLPCQFPDHSLVSVTRKPGFAIGGGAISRLGTSLDELRRRSRVADEAHEARRADRKAH